MASVTILSDNGATSGSAGLKTSGGNDGVLLLQTTTSGGTATNAIYVDTSQNVGLGTTPAAKLHLLTTGNTTADGVRLTFGSEARSHNIYSALPTGRDLTIAPYRALTINTGSGTNEGVLTLNAYEYTVFGTGSSYTERMRLDSSGNLGLGVTPSTIDLGKFLEVGQLGCGVWTAAARNVLLNSNLYYNGGNKYATTGAAGSFQIANGVHYWYNAPSGTAGNAATLTQAMILDASGRLGIGVTSPTAPLTIASASTAAAVHIRGRSDGYGDVIFYSNDGATQYGFVEGGTTGLNLSAVGATSILFGTNGSERARIDSSGRLLVGLTSVINGSCTYQQSTQCDGNQVQTIRNTAASSPYLAYWDYSGATPNNAGSYFLQCNDPSANRFQLRSNGGLANYSANNVNLSDRREKTNFAPAGDYLAKICAIPVQTFNYIDQNLEEDDGLTLGVVAQDVQAVAPELVMESNWGTKDEPKMRLSVYQTDLQYALMKCIQEQQAIITQLQADVQALKGQA